MASASIGIQSGATPPAPLEGDVSSRADLAKLPDSLESALTAFRADGALRNTLGRDFSQYYEISRNWELQAWQRAVSDWERERYIRTV